MIYILTTTDLLGRSNLLSLPAELLVQIAKELYTPPTSNLETGILLTRFYRMPRAPEVRPLHELEGEAEHELQLFTLLYVNRQMRAIALGVFGTTNRREWGDKTCTARLDEMRDEEARIIFEKVCGRARSRRDSNRFGCLLSVRETPVEVKLKAWEQGQGFRRSAAVWRKTLLLTGAPENEIGTRSGKMRQRELRLVTVRDHEKRLATLKKQEIGPTDEHHPVLPAPPDLTRYRNAFS